MSFIYRRINKVKIFSYKTQSVVENQYNQWREQIAKESVPYFTDKAGQKQIENIEKQFSISDTKYSIAVFYTELIQEQVK